MTVDARELTDAQLDELLYDVAERAMLAHQAMQRTREVRAWERYRRDEQHHRLVGAAINELQRRRNEAA